VPHLHQDLAGTGSGHGTILHRHLAGGDVDGDGHDLGHVLRSRGRGHVPVSPIIWATRARWMPPEPNMACVVFTRFTYMCMSCSQV
jgi:hypothetical protein